MGVHSNQGMTWLQRALAWFSTSTRDHVDVLGKNAHTSEYRRKLTWGKRPLPACR